MICSSTISELATALSLAQGEIETAKKDAENPFFKSKYATLADVWEVCRQPLTKNGLSVTQLLGNKENMIVVETVLLHKSGEWISSTFEVPAMKLDPQAYGSACTYGRRYALSAICNVATEEDDDAEKAMGRKATESTQNTVKKDTRPITSSPTNTPQPKHAEYQGRIKEALLALYDKDYAAWNKKLIEMNTWVNDGGKTVVGTKDLPKTEKGLQILCHKLEALVKVKVKKVDSAAPDALLNTGEDVQVNQELSQQTSFLITSAYSPQPIVELGENEVICPEDATIKHKENDCIRGNCPKINTCNVW